MGRQGALVLTPASATGFQQRIYVPLALELGPDLSYTWSTHGLYVVGFALSHCMSRVRGAAARLYYFHSMSLPHEAVKTLHPGQLEDRRVKSSTHFIDASDSHALAPHVLVK